MCVLLSGGDIRMHSNPCAREDGDEATPDNVPKRSAAGASARRRSTVFRYCAWDRHCEGSLEDVDDGKKEKHGSAEASTASCPSVLYPQVGAQEAVQIHCACSYLLSIEKAQRIDAGLADMKQP
jgi:hypothetical protein